MPRPVLGKVIDNTPFNVPQYIIERRDAVRWCFEHRKLQRLLEWHRRWTKSMDLMPLPPGDADKMNEQRLLFICVLIVRDEALADLWLAAKRVMRDELDNTIWSFDEIDYSKTIGDTSTVQRVCDALNAGNDPRLVEDMPLITDGREHVTNDENTTQP